MFALLPHKGMASSAISLAGKVEMWIFSQRSVTSVAEFIGLNTLLAGKTNERDRAVTLTVRPMAGSTGYSFFIVQPKFLRFSHITRNSYTYWMPAGHLGMTVSAYKIDVPGKLKLSCCFVLWLAEVAD